MPRRTLLSRIYYLRRVSPLLKWSPRASRVELTSYIRTSLCNVLLLLIEQDLKTREASVIVSGGNVRLINKGSFVEVISISYVVSDSKVIEMEMSWNEHEVVCISRWSIPFANVFLLCSRFFPDFFSETKNRPQCHPDFLTFFSLVNVSHLFREL